MSAPFSFVRSSLSVFADSFLLLQPSLNLNKNRSNNFGHFVSRSTKTIMDTERKSIYHERQRLQFCLLHSLNNLYQEKDAFTRADLDAIAEKLDIEDPNKTTTRTLFSAVIFKPHHNVVTGNYDVNVLIAALEEMGKRVMWHDRRSGASSIDLDDDKLFGIVLNVPVRKYGGLWRSRHWIALRRIESVWYNLDSDFSAPYPFRNAGEIRKFLDGVISTGGEVLLVSSGVL